jgi:SAM-dependent methyltransferase
MSVRYVIGCAVFLMACVVSRVLDMLQRVGSFLIRLAVILWTPREIERYSRAAWDRRELVEEYSQFDTWLNPTEQTLVEKYLPIGGEVLNLACGAGREALLLARRGLKVTACDWSPRMIAAAQRRADAAGLLVRFSVSDLYNLPYREGSFDSILITNIAYSYAFPRRCRIRLLQDAYAVLKPGGVFILSFCRGSDNSNGSPSFLQRLALKLRGYPPFNRDYEPGDDFSSVFFHVFQPDELRGEFAETPFILSEWRWGEGYAVLGKP